MRFHLTMFFMVIAVSLGMHAMASAAPLDTAEALTVISAPLACTPGSSTGL